MRKLVSTVLVLSVVALAGCASEKPLSEAEQAARETLALPIYPELTLEQKEYIVSTIKEYFNNKSP